MTTHGPHKSRNTFRKVEKLCSQKIISGLFEPGFFVQSYPFRLRMQYSELPVKGVPAQVVFVAGKRRFKRAVDRNYLKRCMRELYRTRKHRIYESLQRKNRTAAFALFYSGAEVMSLKEMEPAFDKLINKLLHEMAVQ